jgi:methylase of polypeptide subunit release factors
MSLSEIQLQQFRKQIAAHNHDNYVVDINLDDDNILESFSVHAKVLRPEKVTAIHLARWLFNNNGLYMEKNVLDLGSGTGIQGVIMGLYGAKHVTFSDVSDLCYANTKENAAKYGLEDKSEVYRGDLFEKIKWKYDAIVFNHPFFFDDSIDNVADMDNVELAMLDRGKIIHRFLEEAKVFLETDGTIVMPYYHVAGEVNDPGVQALKHNYCVNLKMRREITSGLQQGLISIYELRLK